MKERRTGAEGHKEVQLDNTFWTDFSNARKAIEALPGWETASIFGEVGRDQRVIEVLQEVRKFLSKEPDPMTLSSYITDLAGYLFEEYACRLTSKRIGMFEMDGIVLSPDQTFEIYRIANPNLRVVSSHAGLRKTLQGDMPSDIRVPDGIVVQRNQGRSEIKAICEYSLGKLNDRKKSQRNRFRSRQAVDDILVGGILQQQIGEYLAQLDPGLSKNLQPSDRFLFIYIVPDKEPAEGFTLKLTDMTCRIHVPFTGEAFKDVVNALIQDIQNSLRTDPEINSG